MFSVTLPSDIATVFGTWEETSENTLVTTFDEDELNLTLNNIGYITTSAIAPEVVGLTKDGDTFWLVGE